MALLEFDRASLRFGRRSVWSGLSASLREGEFLAVLGPNGSGKSSLLRVVLGLQPLSGGSVEVAGRQPRRGDPAIGYVPQQRRLDPLTPLRARDAVAQALDGHRWGTGWPSADRRARIDATLESVEAGPLADMPIGLLSGGEQQRIRIAQALIGDPRLLLCDEPLQSLDLASQRTVTSLVERRRRTHGTAVVFVTHEINPVLSYVDRVLYLARGQARVGTVDEVLNSAALTALYGGDIEVVHAGGRILVAGIPDEHHHPIGTP